MITKAEKFLYWLDELDMEDVDEEIYDDFLDLLESIKERIETLLSEV